MVGLLVKDTYYTLGSAAFLGSFFDTVHYHLENGEWGCQYPILLDKLYSGSVNWQKAGDLQKELHIIKERLKSFTPDQVIWDLNDLTKQPPWGRNISNDITSLSHYFRTSDGAHDLIDILDEALQKSIDTQSDVVIS